MNTSDTPGSFTNNDGLANDDINATLERYLSYISALARKELPGTLGHCDSDDLVQNSLIKIWFILLVHGIDHPEAYIRRVVRNEMIDMARRYKPYQYLMSDDEGELCQGKALMTPGSEFGNPEDVVLQKEAVRERLNSMIDAMGTLRPRQKLATTCAIQDTARDIPEVEEVLEDSEIGDGVSWSQDRREKQRLQASLPPARRKLKKYMDL